MSGTAFATASTSPAMRSNCGAWQPTGSTRSRLSKPRCSKRWARRHGAMSGETGSLPEPSWSSLERGRFTYLPVVPGRLEFSIEVRRRILAERPAVVAVELPETLETTYLEAIQRLPQISVIFYNDPVSRSQRSDFNDESEPAVYVPVEPA